MKYRKLIYLTQFPKNCSGNIQWKQSIGKTFFFKLEGLDEIHTLKLIGYSSNSKIDVCVDDAIYFDECRGHLSAGSFVHKLGMMGCIFKYNIGDIVDDLEILKYVRMKNCNARFGYLVKCIHDGYIYEIRADVLNSHKTRRCPVCSNKKIIKDINSVSATNPELVRWFKNKNDADNISRHSTQYSLFKCPYCGNEFKYQLNAIPEGQDPPCRCKKDISYAEKMMKNIFDQLNIDYIYQLSKKHFMWCKKYRYDFYFVLNGNQYIVEMDGGLGHGNVNFIGESDTKGKQVDNIKNDLANQHNITLIRIDCFYKTLEDRFEYIKNNILLSDLKNILNLSSIDWNEVKTCSDSSLLYQVCKLYNENYTITDIIKELKIGKTTVLRKLRTGASVGIVDYNPKTEYQNYINSKYNGSQLGRAIPIKVYKDNNLIGIFCSISNFKKNASSVIGEKVDRHLISQALKNGTTYKSKYTFSYTSKEEYLNYYQKLNKGGKSYGSI